MDYIEVDIKKPLYFYEDAPFVNIRDKYLNQAKSEHKYLKITTPTTTHYTLPEDWIKTGKRLSEVFLFKDRPMILWGNYATQNDPPEDKEVGRGVYLNSMTKLRDIAKAKGIIK
jgi:hypothetical protein